MRNVKVAIIGGGIIGCSVAYHLAKKGETSVVVLERLEEVGNWETARSAAMIMHQTGMEEVSRLAKKSIEEYKTYPKSDIGLHMEGSILFTTKAYMRDEIERRTSMQRSLGIESVPLTPSQIRDRLPMVNTDDMLSGCYCPGDGHVDPNDVVRFFYEQARDAGIEFLKGCEATPMVSERKIRGVKIDKEEIEARFVVNAAGAMARLVGKKVRLNIPITSNIRQLATVKPQPAIGEFPIFVDIDNEWYFRPETGGHILFGEGTLVQHEVTETNKDYYPPKDDSNVAMRVSECINHRLPKLINSEFLTSWPGIRSCTPDGLPILGYVDGIEGYINCCGMSGFGVTIAPACGSLTAELIVDGKTSIPLDPFLLSRFRVISP